MKKLKMFRVLSFEFRRAASLRSIVSICLLISVSCLLTPDSCATVTNLYLNVNNTEFIRRVAAITNNEASITRLNASTNWLLTAVTNLNTATNALAGATNALNSATNLLNATLTADVADLLDTQCFIQALSGNITNVYMSVSRNNGTPKQYFFNGITNNRPQFISPDGDILTYGMDGWYINPTDAPFATALGDTFWPPSPFFGGGTNTYTVSKQPIYDNDDEKLIGMVHVATNRTECVLGSFYTVGTNETINIKRTD